MNQWREVTLGDVTSKIGSGATPRGGKEAYSEEGTALIRSMNVRDEGFDYSGLARVDEEQAERLSHVTVEAGDVLVNITGASVARCCLAPRAALPARVNQHVAIVRLRQDEAVPRFVSAYLTSPEGKGRLLNLASAGATREALTKAMLERFTVRLPDFGIQRRVASILEAIDDLIENNRRRVEVLEEMARAIYREWFVHFRYPGHEEVELVDSSLGPIPNGWAVEPVSALASSERNSVTGGPFGSKLGRKDYVDTGVPVLRGANLRVGGGFDETDLVFVSKDKADELRSSIAVRGDVVVTQRGTLGQVGLIPAASAFDRYVLSQSQMRIQVDRTRTTSEFVYSQMRSPETTDRFVAQAMVSGVPHVNLTLLREFELLVPPHVLQLRFTDHARALHSESWALKRAAASLTSIRDRLLPKLVTGQVDVSRLDLDELVEVASA